MDDIFPFHRRPVFGGVFNPAVPGADVLPGPGAAGLKMPLRLFAAEKLQDLGRLGRRQYREIQLDLTYLVDYNLPNMQQLYQQAAAILDENLNSFPYVGDGTGEAVFLTYDRQWRIDLDALHYNFALHVWEDLAVDNNPMQTLQELNQGVTND